MHRLRQVIQWGHWLDPKFINTRSMDYLGALEWSPPDAGSMSELEQMSLRTLANNAIKTFSTGWCTWFIMKKTATTEYPDSKFPDDASQAVDDEARRQFEMAGTQYDTRFYVAPMYTPPLNTTMRLSSFFGGGNKKEDDFDAHKETFEDGINTFASSLGSVASRIERLSGNDLATFLSGFVNRYQGRVRAPAFPAFIYDFFCSDDLLPGFQPAIGTFLPDQDGGYAYNGVPCDASHLRVLRVTAEPKDTFPAMLRRLHAVSGEFTVSAAWMPFAYEDAERELGGRLKAWAGSISGRWKGIVPTTPEAQAKMVNLDSDSRSDQCNAGLAQLQSGDSTFGLWRITITVLNKDEVALSATVKQMQAIFRSMEITATVVRDNVLDSFLSGVPGHPLSLSDRFLGSSQKFSDFLPCSTKWQGPRWDEHFNAPVLMRCAGEDGIWFNLALHQPGQDRSHLAIIGASGAGKSSFGNKICMQFRRYTDSQIFIIGKKGASKLPTLAMGGVYHALEPGNRKVSLQPLARVDQESEFPWAFELMLAMLSQEGLAATSKQKERITDTLKHLGKMPVEQRTLTDFRNFIQDREIREKLGVFCRGGVAGDLLDNDNSSVEMADVTCFETLKLMENKTAMGPVLACICHEIERRFNGRPTLVWIDEAGLEFEFPILPAAVRKWTKLARHANVTVMLSTQSLDDIPPSMALLISEAMEHRIYTANVRAGEDLVRNMLRGYGLSDEKIDAIQFMRPKRDYAMQSPAGWRVFEDVMEGAEFDFCCAGDNQAVLREVDEVYARSGPRGMAMAWLEHRAQKRIALAA